MAGRDGFEGGFEPSAGLDAVQPGGLGAARLGQPAVAGIVAHLEDTVEAAEELFGIFAATPGNIEVHDTRRIPDHFQAVAA